MEDEMEGEIDYFIMIFVLSSLRKFLGNYILLSLLSTDVINLNAAQLILPKEEDPQKKFDFKKFYAIKPITFTFMEEGETSSINQVLKTILNLMNKIPVEEEVSWENIRQIRQNYVNLASMGLKALQNHPQQKRLRESYHNLVFNPIESNI